MFSIALMPVLAIAAASSIALAHGPGAEHGVRQAAQRADTVSQAAVPLYDNLGRHHYQITAKVPLAQRYFDQGLRLYYAFNHQESIRAFNEAARLDPSCAMCQWGIALAHGPNINAPMDARAGRAAYAAIRKALALAFNASARERDLIEALSRRYGEFSPEDRAALDKAYADAMGEVVARHGDDLEARTLYAESLMDLSPWNYWTADGKPRASTVTLLSQLEQVMAVNPDHPGAIHFYIHAVEAAQPERAVAPAERLAGLMPGAGHIVHMPGHIYIRVGRYADAIRANEHAIHADEAYIRDHVPAAGIYVAGYYPHNYDFLAFAASMAGRSAQAIAASEKMASLTSPELSKEPGMTFVQHHHTRHLQMKVRFGRWEDILAAPAPEADLHHARAMWHYARGRALAARGAIKDAEAELVRLSAAADRAALAALRLEFNASSAVLAIAGEALAGHIAAARNDLDGAIGHLTRAAHHEDRLVYGEPPEWSVPVRQELGLVLLAAGRAGEAERAFREDLKRFPKNGWSLHGLVQALRAQHRTAEADEAERRLKDAWSKADVGLAAAGS